MDNKRKIIICLYFVVLCFSVNANDFYNSLVDDLLNACCYGYKGIDLTTGEIDFSNNVKDGYVESSSDTSFYIQSYKGFFKVENKKGEILYTRNGEFVKRGNDYYLAHANYYLTTEIFECDDNSGNKRTQIFHPTESSTITRKGYLFIISEVETREEVIIPNRLELPNIKPIMILLNMKQILKESPEENFMRIEIVNRMLYVLIEDKMHEYYIRRNYSQFDMEKYQLLNNMTNLDQLNFIYSTNWSRTFSEYIEMLYY